MTYPYNTGMNSVMPSSTTNPDIDLALAEIQECVDQYESAREYDDINIWETNNFSRLGRTLRQADIQYDPNFCGVVIDAVNNRLEISNLTAIAGTTDYSNIAEDIWNSNNMELFYREWNRNALRDGDAYITVWPTYDETEMQDEVTTNNLDLTPTGVNITYVDPTIGRMFYDEENPRKKKFFAQLWSCKEAGKTIVRLNLFYPDRIEKYIAEGQHNELKSQYFVPFYDDAEDGDTASQWPMPNPYNEIPVFHLRTFANYGKPEHRNAFGLQDGISKLLEMLMVTVEFNGYPQRYAIQEAQSLKSQMIDEDPTDPDGSFATTGDDGELIPSAGSIATPNDFLSNETGTGVEASPATLQLFKGIKDLGTWTTGDPNVFLEPWREFAKAISSTTDTPLYMFQGMGQDTPSGAALRIAERPLNKKVQNRARGFGSAYSDVIEFSLKVLGYVDVNVTLGWANPAQIDTVEAWEIVQVMMSVGVPRKYAYMTVPGVTEAMADTWASENLPTSIGNQLQNGRGPVNGSE